jgi:CHASE3 domain sensor protein
MLVSNWLTFAGSALTFVGVIVGAYVNLRKTREVHSLVNSQHDDLVARTDQLTGALQDAGVRVPRNGTGGVSPPAAGPPP